MLTYLMSLYSLFFFTLSYKAWEQTHLDAVFLFVFLISKLWTTNI